MLLLLAGLVLSSAPHAHAALGEMVENTASVSYDVDGAFGMTLKSNTATFMIEARRTPSEIEFFRVAPMDPNAFATRINGADYSPGGQGGDFVPVGAPLTLNGVELDFSGEVRLSPTTTFIAGELVIVRVVDAGQNGDPNTIETLEIVVESGEIDVIRLRLYESGPDTGEFYAYMRSSREHTPVNDAVLTTPGATTLTATYQDRFDAADISVDTALVDPFGRVFDSLSGELINGVTVQIVDAATGQPADVFGIDGVSRYPSTLVTGSVVTDASGLEYPLQPGEFLFPLMFPGEYRLLILPPERYQFPSSRTADTFQALDNAPFEIIPGSYGGVFTVEATGPLNFDVPLDPLGELILTKGTRQQTASIGDFIAYNITVENRDVIPAPIVLQDTLPEGFRYNASSARIDGRRLDEPEIAPDGRTLLFRAGVIFPGERISLTYIAGIGAGAGPGEAVNRVVAVNGAGAPISNRAEAALLVREDLLRSRLTIVGRVVEDACDGEQDWAKDLERGIGVPGVRLYMENGEYVVTDEDGLYHFEGVERGTHVVQIDDETLPQGYEPMICEENSRYAGSAHSKFVDATGGTIWRANFYLKRTGELAVEEVATVFNDATEYLEFDEIWLEAQDDTPAWVYPMEGRTPSSRSVNLGIKHAAGQTVALTVNGAPVSALNFSGRDTSADRKREISRWRGVDILDGRNDFIAVVKNGDGSVASTFTRTVWFVSQVERVTLVDDQSVLVADGRTSPVVAVRIEDRAGRPVHAGRIIDVDVFEPYQLANQEAFEREAAVTALTRGDVGTRVGPDGVARIALEPTLQTGRLRVLVKLDNGRTQEIDTYLQPEERDWIVVGLASANGGFDAADGEASSLEPLRDDRIAFFAKGMIKGDWLLTLAVDTAKRRGLTDGSVFDRIDPNAYYTLYGDRTFQFSDAESRYPVYAKLEKNTAQILFGDYDTNLNETVLGQYSRRMSGLRGEYHTDGVSVTAFAAETNQGFIQDEIAADGTSGPYVLKQAPLVRNSEIVTVETRDRLRPDDIIATEVYQRYIDYEIDYDNGELIFRHPVNATDDGFNPNVIVVDYEVAAGIERNITFGGRAAVRPFGTDRLEAGVTYIREEGDAITEDATSDLLTVDVSARITPQTEVRAEIATSSRETQGAGEGGEAVADAYLAEIIHQSGAVNARAYVREDAEGFGLGQQGSNTVGLRRHGAQVSARISEATGNAASGRDQRFIEGEAYQETSLVTDASRRVVEAQLRQEGVSMSVAGGLRQAEESYADGERRQSVLATGTVRKSFFEHGLTVSASHEEPLFSEDDSATQFPQRTILGADKSLTQRATLNLRHEITNGADASGENTVAGVTVTPWAGGEARVAVDALTQDAARRIGATVGVDQAIQINDTWSATIGAAHRARIDGGDDPRDVTADAPVSPLADGIRSPLAGEEGYTSVYAGAGFRAERTAAAARIENRASELGNRVVGTVGAAREASDELSFAVAGRVQYDGNKAGPDQRQAEARVGVAWRPRGEGPVVYNRLDLVHDETFEDAKSWKIVNNLGVNAMVTKRTQVAAFSGVKYVETSFSEGDTAGGMTYLLGGEVRHDISKRVDIGFSASTLRTSATGTSEYAWGPSIGVTPAKNVWISVGYNVEGFTDRDFEAAEYSREGAYLKLRVKFDQNTLHGLLEKVSPKGR